MWPLPGHVVFTLLSLGLELAVCSLAEGALHPWQHTSWPPVLTAMPSVTLVFGSEFHYLSKLTLMTHGSLASLFNGANDSSSLFKIDHKHIYNFVLNFYHFTKLAKYAH